MRATSVLWVAHYQGGVLCCVTQCGRTNPSSLICCCCCRSVTEALEVAARERGYELKSLFFLSQSAMFAGYSAEWFRAIEEKQGVAFKHAAPITLPTLKHLGEARPSPPSLPLPLFYSICLTGGGRVRRWAGW